MTETQMRRFDTADATNDFAMTVRLRVNGRQYRVLVEPRTSLLQTLRDELALTGTKQVCNVGQCGACTVLRNDAAVYSCLTLAAECDGDQITTIEGLAKPQALGGADDGDPLAGLDPIQRAFIENDAYQCGFCTPGQIMSLRALFNQNPTPTLDEVKGAISGNLCRCGAYPAIFRAAMTVSQANAQKS